MPKLTPLSNELNNKYCPASQGMYVALHIHVFRRGLANGMFLTCDSENAMLC